MTLLAIPYAIGQAAHPRAPWPADRLPPCGEGGPSAAEGRMGVGTRMSRPSSSLRSDPHPGRAFGPARPSPQGGGKGSGSSRLKPLLVALLASLLAVPALAEERVQLRGDVVATRDVLTLGDLVEGAPAGLAGTALFRAPALGAAGTVQTRRIVEAAASLGLAGLETGGRLQVAVTRAARRVGPAEIEAALKAALEREAGLDPRATAIAFDGQAPTLLGPPDLVGEARVAELQFDRRTRRLTGTIWLGTVPSERRAALAVSGAAVETVEVAILNRALDRGETVRPGDVALERRPRDGVPADAAFDGGTLDGRVARRPLLAGGALRAADLARPELVGRGDTVTMVYEAPGIALSMRGRATEAGALGDTIPILNPGSKKTVFARVIGPGKVSVVPGETQRSVASATTSSLR